MKNRTFWRPLMDQSPIDQAAQQWGVEPWTAELFMRRQVDPQQLDDRVAFPSPYVLTDMEQAASLIRSCLSQEQHVRIYGDYDADGVTATAVLVRGLGAMGYAHLVDYYIPNRFDEGYGLHDEAIEEAKRDGISLVVTVDCGSSSPSAADLARELGVGLVITDHHALPDSPPAALALVNPERDPGADRFSGAGVALQLMRALMGDQLPLVLWGIAAIGTVADVVPLLGANRRLVAEGLEAIRQGRVGGVSALFAHAGRPVERASAQDLAFLVGPHLNAAGRMGDAEAAVRLLLGDENAALREYAVALSQLNHSRQAMEREIIGQAWQRLPRDDSGQLYPFTVIAGEDWHQGVVGIVASRFREWLGRPVAVVTWAGDEGKGSARSVEGLNLIAHLRKSPQLFSKLGGHPGAAGFSLPRRDPADLSRILSEDLSPEVRALQYLGPSYDLSLGTGQNVHQLWRGLRELEPFGRDFESPRFLVAGRIKHSQVMGKEGDHVRLTLEYSAAAAVGFGWGRRASALMPGDPVRFIATLETNWYRGQESPQWHIAALDVPWPRRLVALRRGTPDPIPRRTIWIADSDALVGEAAARLRARPYRAAMPRGELFALVEEARRGLADQVVVSQWRDWPNLLDWADAVIWLCTPRNQAKWEEAAALLNAQGAAWLAADSQPRPKATRLAVNRERLARHWRLWGEGRAGLIGGRSVFGELELTPELARQGRRRPVEQSYLYQMAVREQECDARTPFEGEFVGEEEMDGLD